MALPMNGMAAGSVLRVLNVRDTKTVTRAEFIKAVVDAAKLPLVNDGTVPYKGVPDDLAPYVRAAHGKNALSTLAKAGSDLHVRQGIRRGEAVAVLQMLLHPQVSGDWMDSAKRFTDLYNDAQRQAVAVATHEGWMKPESTNVFGFRRPLRGKEAKLLLGRVFALSTPSADPAGAKETITVPVIRVQVTGTSRQPVPKEDLLQEVWNILRKNFLFEERIDHDNVGDKAIEGLVNGLSDPYTTYMPKVKNDDFKLQMQGEVEGIGATVEMTGSVLRVVSPIRGSPAEKAGVKPRDEILSVNGESVRGLTLDEAVRKIRGPAGSTATLRIRRGSEEFDLPVKREKVRIPEVEVTYDRNVAVIRLLQFWDTTDKQFRDVMKQVQSEGVRGIILDLRNNPGGLLHAAGVVAGSFLPKDSTYATILERSGSRNELTEDQPVVHASTPLIVLVNNGSASASEIVAGALQDAKRARLVGEKTYGKGTVQQVVQFSDGSSLKYTVAEWRTPNGREINKHGVEPDVTVMNDDGGKDLQLEKAFELLR